MIRDHARVEELIAIRALDGLDPDDERVLEREQAEHGPGCAECRQLEADYADVAGRLAFAVDPEPLRDGFEDEVVGLATGSRALLEPVDGVSTRRARRQRRPAGLNLRPLVAAAAAIVLFGGGWAAGSLLSRDESAVPPDARVVAFEGAGGGSLSVAYRPGEAGVYVVGSGLATPPENQVYEVWMIRDGTPVPGPCLRPQPDGSLFAFTDAELGTTEAMAVTVEPASCSTQPTSDPVFTAMITA